MSQCAANILLNSIRKSNLRFSGSKFLINLRRQFRARKQASIYNAAFLGLQFLQKISIIDVRLGYIKASENIEIFREKLI